MNLQFISDSTGKTTGVFIPIEAWNKLKLKFKGIDQEEFDLPIWHKSVVNERLESYSRSDQDAIDDIEKSL